MPLVLRNVKGSQLTFNEMDGNFTYLEGLDQDKLTTSSFNTFTSSYTTGSFTGSFRGDGSGLTGIPGVTPIATGSFATTGSNQFKASQTISGSLTVSGSISQFGIGTNNTFIGSGSGQNTLTNGGSIWNTFIGVSTGQSNIAGGDNTYIGAEAGKNSISTIGNTFVGAGAGTFNISGEFNSFFGTYAGLNTSIGIQNTFVGYAAAYDNISGSNNVAMGQAAARYAANGSTPIYKLDNSVFIGNNIRANADNQTNQIVIGATAIGNGSNTVVIGNTSITSTTLRGSVSASLFSGSFVGDGSGLTGIPGVTPIATGSFATTGSNIFVGNQTVTGSLTVSGSITHRGNQTITGSLNVSGSITVPGSGSYRDFVNDSTKFRSIRGNGSGLFNIIEQSDSNISFAVSKITTNDLTGAITSNLSGANNNSYNDLQPTTSGVGQGARLMLTIAGGIVTSVRIFNISNSNNSYEEDGQPANRQGIGYVAGDTLTLAAGTGGIGGSGNLIITLRPQDIETYLGVDSNFKFNYHESPELQISTNTFGTNIGIGGGIADGIGSIAAGTGTVAAGSTGAAIAVGFQNLASSTSTSVFGAYNTGSDAQTVVGIAAITLPGLESAFIIGNGNNASDRSNLLVAAGNEVQVTGSLLVTGSANVNGFVVLPQISASLNFANDTAAASGGVPLGGLYRSGSFIQIRLV